MPTPIENNTIQLQQLIEKANSLPSKLILTDDVTDVYKRQVQPRSI